MKAGRVLAGLILALVGLLPGSALAQTSASPIDFSFGYQLLHIPDETYPFGLNADIGFAASPTLRFVAEVGYARDTSNLPSVAGTLMFYNYGAGGRWTAPSYGRLSPFLQVLVGGVHSSANLSAGNTVTASANAFMFQPGVGVEFPVTEGVSVLGQIDYRRAFFSPAAENEFRVVTGVRFGVR